MRLDVFDHLKGHYASVADELRSKAEQAALLVNSGDVGTDREGVYRAFLERHLPKTCDVFLGGYLFDLNGKSSAQMDVIVTSGNTPRFRMQDGSRHIAPLEGSVAVAEVKSRLDRDSLRDALEKCASIPRMPDRSGVVPLYLKVHEDHWLDTPYKIVFAYDGIRPKTAYEYVAEFYNQHAHIPIDRRANMIHVLGKYLVMRTTRGMTVISVSGEPREDQPEVGQYEVFTRASDVSAMGWMLNTMHKKALLAHHLLFKYDELHNKIIERV